MNRIETRIAAIQILYTSVFNNISFEAAIKCFNDGIVEDSVIELLNLVKNDLEKIDSIISDSLVNYTITRLNLVDKAIIRLATAEMLNGQDKRVAINEALEITKEYSDHGDRKAVSFNNRLLDTISNNIVK